MGGYSNPEFDALVDTAYYMDRSDPAYVDTVQELEDMYLNDFTYIPLMIDPYSYYVQPWVKNLRANRHNVIYTLTDIFLLPQEEMVRKRGYGHSTWQQGVKLCQAAGARQLALFHHDPARTDTQLDAIEQRAVAEFGGAFAARDGQVVEFERIIASPRRAAGRTAAARGR